MKKCALAFLLLTGICSTIVAQSTAVRYHWKTIDGIKLFYRTAGNPGRPAIVLLHGFPSSSVMYQELMLLLKEDFYLIAPDYPGHGYSDVPPASYALTFENIAKTIDHLLQQLNIQKYSLFMQDYGSPVGFRVALKHPENIRALIIQNANAYMEGFPEAQDPNGSLRQYWIHKDTAYENDWIEYYRAANSLSADKRTMDSSLNPDRRVLDAAVMLKPGRLQLFLDLWYDYGNNVKSYPQWQQYLKTSQPPTLITWGKEDTYFIVPGAMAYLKDLPKAEVHLLNGGHWAASDTNTGEIADLIKSFFSRNNLH